VDGGGVFCLIVLIVVGVVVFTSKNNKAQELQAARERYLEALNKLKQNPRDPNLKQVALGVGRQYSFLTRNKQGITTFDEMALMNDLNAATAHAFEVSAPSPAPIPASYTQSLAPEDRLRKLDNLKNQGLISEEEFADRRAKILEEL
jgi:hypothetical protein